MRHLIISREYPPAPYPAGGIGTYVSHIARLLAEAGEEVHVLAQRFDAAPEPLATSCGGRLVVHRVALDEPIDGLDAAELAEHAHTLDALGATGLPAVAFAWQAAALAERLVARAGIDVIEAQEWEAPLWIFQRRRTLGLGPDRLPPCIVHLHSPTELIFRHNGWETTRPDYLPLTHAEEYSIRHADAWLCPSHFLARAAEQRYGLGPGRIEVIPLPAGDTPRLPRTSETWTSGTVCYVGRLEPRKGVVEWMEAAIAVARERPEVRFEFVGADLPYACGLSVGGYAASRIPPALRDRFRFLGALPREQVRERLALARVAVVPSRWENFPNACLEAMASGLPVIATATGGMPEMVSDGRTGWIAPSAQPHELAVALRRALATTPEALARMGDAAAADIRRVCDNDAIVGRHVELRRQVAARGTAPSTCAIAATAATGAAPLRTEIAVVVRVGDDRAATLASVASVAAQTRAPSVRLLAGTPTAHASDLVALHPALAASWRAIDGPTDGLDAGWAAVAALRPAPLGVVFLDAGDLLAPDHLARCEAALRCGPELGVLAPWGGASLGAPHVRPTLELPWLLLDDGLAPGTVFRVAALDAAGGVRADVGGGLALLEAAVATLASGWSGAVYPAPLASRPEPDEPTMLRAHAERARGRRALLERSRDALADGGAELLVHLESALLSARGPRRRSYWETDAAAAPACAEPLSLDPGTELRAILGASRRLAGAAVVRPGAALGWLLRTTGRVGLRVARRTLRRVAAPPPPAGEPAAALHTAPARGERPSATRGAPRPSDVPVPRTVAVDGAPAGAVRDAGGAGDVPDAAQRSRPPRAAPVAPGSGGAPAGGTDLLPDPAPSAPG